MKFWNQMNQFLTMLHITNTTLISKLGTFSLIKSST